MGRLLFWLEIWWQYIYYQIYKIKWRTRANPISAPIQDPQCVTFTYYVAFTKDSTDDKLLFDIPKLETRKFDKYDGFYTSPAVGPYGPNYVYATTHQLIYRPLYMSAIVITAYTIASLVHYFINGLSGRKPPVDVKRLERFLLFNTDNVVMKNIEATYQLGGFNQRLPMR